MTPSPHESIRWEARLQPAILKRLYDADAQDIHDEDLCDEVTTRRWVDELIPALLAKEPIFKRIRETIQ